MARLLGWNNQTSVGFDNVIDNGQAVKFVGESDFFLALISISRPEVLPMLSLTGSVNEIWEFIGHWAQGPP
jgi:hypothetical protein